MGFLPISHVVLLTLCLVSQLACDMNMFSIFAYQSVYQPASESSQSVNTWDEQVFRTLAI